MTKNLIAVMIPLVLLTSGTMNLWADADSDARQKLAALPNAPLVITIDQASGSPCVVLTDKGALINQSKVLVPFDKVLTALADLPTTAWPYGRVVVMSPPATGEVSPPKAVADKVELTLETANIRLLHAGQ